VEEKDIANVKVGDPVTATVGTLSDLKLTGNVAAISALGAVESGSVQYTVRIDVDPIAKDLFLPLGSTANATIQVKPASPSLAVPITVIQNDAKGEYVLVAQADGSTKRVNVVSGTIVGDLVTVTGDLKEGDNLTASQNSGMTGPGGMFGGRK
jgi:multidrug efflux pump subunit AcrA (membrane-fusion protein)